MTDHDPSTCPNCLAQQVVQSAQMLETAKYLEDTYETQAPEFVKTEQRKDLIHLRVQFLWAALDFWLDEYCAALDLGDDDGSDHGHGPDDEGPDDNPEPPEDPGEEVTLTAHQEKVADHLLDFMKERVIR